MDPKRVIAEGYDRLGPAFSAWNSARPPDVRSWFLGQVLARLPEGSNILELGCGPGMDAAPCRPGADTSASTSPRRSSRSPGVAFPAGFVRGDFTSMAFRQGAFDGVVAFYAFMHVPHAEMAPTLERIFGWLRPGGRLLLTMTTAQADDRVEEWLNVPMFFAGFAPEKARRLLRGVGFQLELSEIREEIEERYGPTDFHWVIARKPVEETAAAPL